MKYGTSGRGGVIGLVGDVVAEGLQGRHEHKVGGPREMLRLAEV